MSCLAWTFVHAKSSLIIALQEFQIDVAFDECADNVLRIVAQRVENYLQSFRRASDIIVNADSCTVRSACIYYLSGSFDTRDVNFGGFILS